MKSKSSKPADLLPRWRVYRLRKTPELVGTVHAKDEAAAIERVVEWYGIADPEKQKRLVARRLD